MKRPSRRTWLAGGVVTALAAGSAVGYAVSGPSFQPDPDAYVDLMAGGPYDADSFDADGAPSRHDRLVWRQRDSVLEYGWQACDWITVDHLSHVYVAPDDAMYFAASGAFAEATSDDPLITGVRRQWRMWAAQRAWRELCRPLARDRGVISPD